ncbi:hypothetical protein INT47_008981 [Mucor saturninus]|uniref:Uncharacterized protein n=1 Tax=Mucor saturninus TaxID=64648 RepID=A0A8H7R1T7_9FUNG|nr:hypothetical protein INT47_008981 [Mucor saturninus]
MDNMQKQHKKLKLPEAADSVVETRYMRKKYATLGGVLPQEAVYIKQLEAPKEKLKADLSLNKVQTTWDKHHQEIMGKNNLIRSLQENIKTLEVQVESIQTNFDQLEDSYMTLKVEAALSSNEEETKMSESIKTKSHIHHLESNISRVKDENQTLMNMLEKTKQSAVATQTFLNSFLCTQCGTRSTDGYHRNPDYTNAAMQGFHPFTGASYLTTTQHDLARSASGLSAPSPVQSLPARRVSALRVCIPPPNHPIIPKGKKKESRLTNFVNSRNPSKVLNSHPIILPVHDRPPIDEEGAVERTKLENQLAL